jgi:ribose-phosphate pyrophosphokinase
MFYSFPGDEDFGRRLADAVGGLHGVLDIHQFPDSETRVRLDTICSGKNVVLVNGGHDPNSHALPLYFATHGARESGASSVGLVAPYLAYMRQDCQFRTGEAVSALAYAEFLSSSFDWLATVDPHLHRIRRLDDVFTIPAICVSSAPAIAAWIAKNVRDPVVIGPDEESAQWVEKVAAELQVPWSTLVKTRTGDRQVSVSAPEPAILRGRIPVLVDDITSSGHTLAEAVAVLRRLGATEVICIVVHALLTEDAESVLHAAGMTRLVSTNTISHRSNAIDVVPLLASHLRAAADSGALLQRQTTGP